MDVCEKSKPIKINNTTETKKIKYGNEFDLNTSCFDPSKFSPPNEFIMKLNLRMNHYNNLRIRFSE